MKNKLSQERLKKVANGIWTSKLRYGLQLYSKVRTQADQPKNANMDSLQLAPKKLLRVFFLRDRVSIDSMLKKQEIMSVNQIAAQIKLTEIWKAPTKANNRNVLPAYYHHLIGLTRLRLRRERTKNRLYILS